MMKALVMAVAMLVCVVVAKAPPKEVHPPEDFAWYSISWNGAEFVISPGKNLSAIATGYYTDLTTEAGAGILGMIGNSDYDNVFNDPTDDMMMFAAGYLEAYLTIEPIANSYINFMSSILNDAPSTALLSWVNKNIAWIEYMVQQQKSSSSSTSDSGYDAEEHMYWAHVSGLINQIQGLAAGYKDYAPKGSPSIDFTFFWLMNSDGDLYDLIPATNRAEAKRKGEPFNDWRTPAEVQAGSHCSVLIKPNADKTEMLAGHEMWATYSQMIQIYKTYEFSLLGTQAAAISMSSYPAYVSSEDDWYLLSSNKIVIETTNSMFNMTLYDYLTTESLPSWMRVMVANRLATNGQEWVAIFSRYNSGTYNNQWMVLDLNRFNPGSESLSSDLLWIAEQSPGLIISGDVSYVIEEQGYWPSYNIPFFPAMYVRMGIVPAFQEYGNVWSYEFCPRANVFRRNESAVNDLDDLRHMMRYNDFQHDPLAMGCPYFQTAARGDLAPANDTQWGGLCSQAAFGAINAKVASSATMLFGQGGYFIAGPTHEEQSPFNWNESPAQSSHVGQPDVFDFDWVYVVPFVSYTTDASPSGSN